MNRLAEDVIEEFRVWTRSRVEMVGAQNSIHDLVKLQGILDAAQKLEFIYQKHIIQETSKNDNANTTNTDNLLNSLNATSPDWEAIQREECLLP